MRVAVFCGSSPAPPVHEQAARAFVRALAEAGCSFVYGGARVGLMGVVADTALAAGASVTGVIPGHLVDREVAHAGLTDLEIVPDMHTRKARMASLADAFVALPGGVGTLDELFEIVTWRQLGLHGKPIAVLDVDGFFDGLFDQLTTMVDAGYLSAGAVSAIGRPADAAEFLGWCQPPLNRPV